MNKCISLSVISLVCVVALTTAYGPMARGGYAGFQSYVPMYYGGGGYGIGGGSGGFGGGGLFSIIFLIFILSFLGNGSLFGRGGKKSYGSDYTPDAGDYK